MSLPDNVLSDQVFPAGFLPPRDIPPQPLIDYEMGGIGLSDASHGMQVKPWRMRWIEGQFLADATGVPPTLVYTRAGVKEFSFTFDQNMKPFITFVDGTGAYFYWYDATVSGYSLVALAAGTVTPKCSLDDKRLNQQSVSDIILAYVRGGNLYYRQQRDRYNTERLLKASAGPGLRRIGMGTRWRFLFEMENG